MAAFQQELDIYNRALQRLGLTRMGSASDQHPGEEIVSSYHKVRRAELRRNLWVFATRTTALRALDTTSSFLNFEAWAAGTTYAANYVVTYNNLTWISTVNGNHGNTPGVQVTSGERPWAIFFGNQVCNAWNDSVQNTITTDNTTYHMGEMAYLLSTGAVYTSVVEGNQNEPDVVDVWSATTMYVSGAVVSFNGTNYQSRVNLNFGYEPDISATQWTASVTNPTVSGSWVGLANATLSTAPIIYPVTAGPSSDTGSRNAYYRPAGFLRMAPQAPKYGSNAWLGAHVGMPYSDLMSEGNYFTSAQYSSLIVLRFIADVVDVSTFDDMFCEGLAARLAMEAAPLLAPDRLRACKQIYDEVMSEARTVDAIETGPIEQDEDEYITVRN